MERNCGNCTYVGNDRIVDRGIRHEYENHLVCRRYPPSIGSQDENVYPMGIWPTVTAEDRCGEFQPKGA